MMASKVTCDVPQCKSCAELSAVDDLKNIRDALDKRGWLVSYPKNGGKVLHLCPVHSEMVRREGWTAVREQLEGKKDDKPVE